MSKFYSGQSVVCVDDSSCASTLVRGQTYSVFLVEQYSAREFGVQVAGINYIWRASRFEDYDTWAAHQVKASDADELYMTKLQITSLQEVKKNALEREQKLVEALWGVLPMAEDNCKYWGANPETDAEVMRARNTLKELGL